MQQESKHRWLRTPSPAMIVALIALVFAMSGTAVAASKLISGDKIIKKGSLSGNRLRAHTVTGTQIKVSTLGKVPSAALADSATHATSADSATSATHATSADTATSAGPSGAAGGDLGGSYPSPTIASGAVGSAKIANGAVDTTKLGAFPGARVRSSVDQVIPGSTYTTLTFDTVDTNVGGVWNASHNDRLRAPVVGSYVITAAVWWQSNATGNRVLWLLVNGSTYIAYAEEGPASNGNLQQNIATVYHLNAGDYVQALVDQSSTNPGGLSSSAHAKDAPILSLNWIGQ
jgi:hypothetical protein